MKTTSVLVTLCLYVLIEADRHEKIMCKPQSGFQLSRCDPTLSWNSDEYPITCLKTSAKDNLPNEEIRRLKRQMKSIQKEWEDMKSMLAEMRGERGTESDCARQGGLVRLGKCYTVPHLSSSYTTDYDEAAAECAKEGASLAEIHDRAQQGDLHKFALTKMPAGHSYVFVWVGMTYNPQSSMLLYKSGKEIRSSRLKWRPSNNPSTEHLHKYLSMMVNNHTSDFGLINQGKFPFLHGGICEKEI